MWPAWAVLGGPDVAAALSRHRPRQLAWSRRLARAAVGVRSPRVIDLRETIPSRPPVCEPACAGAA